MCPASGRLCLSQKAHAEQASWCTALRQASYTWHRMCRLVMGSRCGDMDPAVVLYLMQKGSLSAQEADKLMNKQSGFLGLCGHADVRVVQEAADSGDEKAEIALEVSSGDWMC